MSAGEKVERVLATKDEFGLNQSLEMIGLPKSTWYYHRKQQVAYEEKYAHLRLDLETIARNWPEYGYRRTTKALREKMGREVNQKVVRRLHQSFTILTGIIPVSGTEPAGVHPPGAPGAGRIPHLSEVKLVQLFGRTPSRYICKTEIVRKY